MNKRHRIINKSLFLTALLTSTGGVSGLCLANTAPTQSAPLKSEVATSKAACTASETWTLPGLIGQEWQSKFRSFLKGNMSAPLAFSEALALRKKTKAYDAKIFAEYWISRAFFDAGLYHIAHQGFTAIASKQPNQASIGVHGAAIKCLSEIAIKYPTLTFELDVISQLHFYPANEIRSEALLLTLLHEIRNRNSSKRVSELSTLVKGADLYGKLSLGLIAVRSNDHRKAIQYLSSVIQSPSLPKFIEKQKDYVLLFLAHSHYNIGDYKTSAALFNQVSKRSNLLSKSLLGLAWSSLQAQDYPKAIGTSIQFNSGAISATFSPDAPVVLSMALTEICQYPAALRAISLFTQSYRKPFFWLKKWKTRPFELYPVATRYLKEDGDVPDKVASEWIRSPAFIARQDEINLILSTEKIRSKVEAQAQQELAKMTKEILVMVETLHAESQKLKQKNTPVSNYPETFFSELEKLREKFTSFQRLRKGAPIWHNILANFEKSKTQRSNQLVKAINQDLKSITLSLMNQISESASTLQLVKMEVYNGATHDIVWQNANPEYKKLAEQIADEKKSEVSQNVWNWGDVVGGITGTEEIWEDELGAFEAQMVDNCTSKEHFMVKKREQLQVRLPASGGGK